MHWFDEPKGRNSSARVAYAGLDVSVRESGTWRGKCRLTKRGNAFLRKRLYSSAWGAWRNDEFFQAYYEQLRESGKQHNEALIIIACKLLRIIFAVLKSGEPYNAERCFSQQKEV